MHGGDIYTNKIKYDFSVNLNPYMPTERIRQAISKAANECVTQYPEYSSDRLRKNLAEKLCIDDAFINMTSGASEAISVAMHVIRPNEAVIIEPAFSGYERALRAAGTKKIIHLSQDEICKEKAYNVRSGQLYFLATPSNPFGKLTDNDTIKELYASIKSNNGYLILDECFINLSSGYNKSMMDSIKAEPDYYDKLIVVRSFTKTFSIPGIRLGYIVCSNNTFNRALRDSLPEWNISAIATEAGIACLAEDITCNLKDLFDEREWLRNELAKFAPSQYSSDTLYFVIKARIDLAEKLLKKGFLIRDCSDYHGLEQGYFRVAVKTHEENAALVNAVKEVYDGI